MPSISSDTADTLLDEYERHMATITVVAKALLTACHRMSEPGDLPDAAHRRLMRAILEAELSDGSADTIEMAVGLMTEAAVNVGSDMLKDTPEDEMT